LLADEDALAAEREPAGAGPEGKAS
jgi:hypothetical protein